MDILGKIKEKSIGAYILAAAAVLSLITMIIYIAFGVGANEFVAGIFVCFLFGFLLCVAALIYEGLPTDLIVFAAVVLFAAALGMFIYNSVNDFTDFISNMPLFGNKENAPMRIVVIVFTLISIVAVIVGTFFKRVKKA